jgi:hypothetical protein
VVDLFADDAVRKAHLAGAGGQSLKPDKGVLFSVPQVGRLNVIADELQG